MGEVRAFVVGLMHAQCQLSARSSCVATIMMFIIVDPQVSVATDDAMERYFRRSAGTNTWQVDIVEDAEHRKLVRHGGPSALVSGSARTGEQCHACEGSGMIWNKESWREEDS